MNKTKSLLNSFLIILSLTIVTVSCSTGKHTQKAFTQNELSIINDTMSPIMKIYVVTNGSDSTFLRMKTSELSNEAIKSKEYETLCSKMIKTVTDSTVDGVGLAGPQIGISRRIVAVQRLDKEGKPFEVYPNIYIKEYSQEQIPGREGCLSVPAESLQESEKKAPVIRSQWVIISYTDPETLQTVQDTVKGYTARIFQHETDHLEGILYTDLIQSR